MRHEPGDKVNAPTRAALEVRLRDLLSVPGVHLRGELVYSARAFAHRREQEMRLGCGLAALN